MLQLNTKHKRLSFEDYEKVSDGIVSIKISISISTIVIASIFSCGVGISFGLYPAKKAASLSPIEALQYE